jgi:hypothetical protein
LLRATSCWPRPQPGDIELHDACGYDEPDDVCQWFADIPAGQQVVVGPHPLLAFDDSAVLIAYVPYPDGRIAPGAY